MKIDIPIPTELREHLLNQAENAIADKINNLTFSVNLTLGSTPIVGHAINKKYPQK